MYDLDLESILKSNRIKEIIYFIEKWFNDHGWPPIRMSLSGPNIPKSNKTKTFAYYKKLLEKNEFEYIEDFWIGATPPDHSNDYFDSRLSAGMNFNSLKSAFALYFHNDIIPKDWLYVETLVNDILGWIKSGYGIAYQRDFDKGPGLYAYGGLGGNHKYLLSSDPVIIEEHNHISKWSKIYGIPERYHHGDLRDIYPLNFISKEHLERTMNSQTLQTWIESSPDHGTLKPLTDTLWTWYVPEDKISSVREALRPSGIILCI